MDDLRKNTKKTHPFFFHLDTRKIAVFDVGNTFSKRQFWDTMLMFGVVFVVFRCVCVFFVFFRWGGEVGKRWESSCSLI